ncbi:hypothetical protein, partial [Nocardia amamiensis]|uniref:hypothetical protein n=1 Tax=Nocardia amamiensis TaxID=404578 RepID=UPI0033D85067
MLILVFDRSFSGAHKSAAVATQYNPSAQLALSSEARPSIARSRPGSRPSGRRVRDEVASGGRS